MKKLLLLCASFLTIGSMSAETFQKVTSAEELSAGDKVFFIHSGASAYYYSAAVSSKCLNSTTVSDELSDKVTIDDLTNVMTVGVNGSNYTFSWSDGKSLGYGGSSTDLAVIASTATNPKNKFTVTFASTGLATITETTSNRYIGWQSDTNARWKIYSPTSSTNAKPFIYKQVESGDPVGPVDYAPDFQDIALFVNETLQLNLGTKYPSEMIFISSDDAIATVSDNGLITATGIGEATIYVSWEGDENFTENIDGIEFTVTVSEKPVAGDILTDEITATSFVGITGNGTYKALTYTSPITNITYSAKISTNYSAIQTNGTSGNGIATTANPNKYVLKKVIVQLNANTNNKTRTLTVYGAEQDFTSIAAASTGSSIGSITKSDSNLSATFDVTDSYTAVGFIANNALYIDKIILEWAPAAVATAPESAKVYFHGTTDEVGESIDLGGSEKKVHFAAAEGVNIFVKFEPDSATEAQADNAADYDGFEPYNGEGFTLNVAGTLKHYTEKDGLKSPVSSITVTGTSTAINEIDAAAKVNAEWFDLQGRRVASPVKGRVYIVKEGSTTSKRAL